MQSNKNLVIDCRIMRPGTGGAETFFFNMLPGLSKIYGEKNIFLMGDKSNIEFCSGLLPKNSFNIILIPLNVSNPIIRYFSSYIVSFLIRRKLNQNFILWHPFNTGALPFLSKVKKVVTVHDTYVFDVKTGFNLRKFFRAKDLINTLKYSNIIITASKYSVTQIGNNFKKYFINKPIKLIPDPISFNTSLKSKSPSLIKHPFMFFISILREQKNIEFMLKCFKKFIELYNYKGYLIIAGNGQTKYENEIKKFANKLQISEKIIWAGRVSEEEKKYLYENCDLFLFPSVYEGFGYPVVEARYYNAKIVTSFAASLNEFEGLYIRKANPYDLDDFVNQMKEQLETNNDIPDDFIVDNTATCQNYVDVFKSLNT